MNAERSIKTFTKIIEGQNKNNNVVETGEERGVTGPGTPGENGPNNGPNTGGYGSNGGGGEACNINFYL